MGTKIQPSFPATRPESFPVKAGKNNFFVSIYLFADGERNGVTYETFKIPYSDNGKRRFHRFTDWDAARAKGNDMIEQLNTGNAPATALTVEDKVIYERALRSVQPFDIGLDTVASQWAEAKEILGNTSLIEAARFFRARHPIDMKTVTVAQAIDDYIEAKEGAKRSDRHIEDLNSRLGKFKAQFGTFQLSLVTEKHISDFLDGLKRKGSDKRVSPRTFNNFRSAIVSFFRWAVKKKLLARDWDEVSAIEVMEDGDGEIEIFSVEDMVAILTHAPDEIIPFLTIGAFAGLRSSEICRLDWKEVGVGNDGKYIEVKAGTAKKTGQRRLVPISDNLRAWLAPYRKLNGGVFPHFGQYIYELLDPVLEKAKVKWRKNGLRHSRISYRVAEIEDMAKVALESGNSQQMIHQHYRELVTQEEAKRWFNIMPVAGRELLTLPPDEMAEAV